MNIRFSSPLRQRMTHLPSNRGSQTPRLMRTLRAGGLVFLWALVILGAARSGLAKETSYVLGTGDVLSITILASGKLEQSVEITVTPEGTVNFPYIGKTKAAGMSISKFTDQVTDILAKYYFVNPRLSPTSRNSRAARSTSPVRSRTRASISWKKGPPCWR